MKLLYLLSFGSACDAPRVLTRAPGSRAAGPGPLVCGTEVLLITVAAAPGAPVCRNTFHQLT